MNNEIDNTNEKLIDENKKGNPNFYKGMPSNNPDGRPKGSKNYLTQLEESLEKEAKKKGISYYDKIAEWCFRYPNVAIAILKKFMPDKNSTELTTPEGIEFIITKQKNETATGKSNKDI